MHVSPGLFPTTDGHSSPRKARCWREAKSASSSASDARCAVFSSSTAVTRRANSRCNGMGGTCDRNSRIQVDALMLAECRLLHLKADRSAAFTGQRAEIREIQTSRVLGQEQLFLFLHEMRAIDSGERVRSFQR